MEIPESLKESLLIHDMKEEVPIIALYGYPFILYLVFVIYCCLIILEISAIIVGDQQTARELYHRNLAYV